MMPSNYPANLDWWPTIGPLLSSTPHSDVHEDLQDAIEAVQTELGTDPAGPSSTVGARFGLYTLIPRTFANRAAVLAATARFAGEAVYETEARRIWAWFGGVDEWRITGGNIPRVTRQRTTTHTYTSSATQFASVDITGHTGIGAEFVVGNTITVPTGMGGDYELAAGVQRPSVVVSTEFYGGVSVSIADNDGMNEAGGYSSVSTASLNPGHSHSASLAKQVRLRAGAALTLQTVSGASPFNVSRSYITLSMVAHAPSLT